MVTAKPVVFMNDLPPSSPLSSSDDEDEGNDGGGQLSQGAHRPCLQPKSQARPAHEFGFMARGRNQELVHAYAKFLG